MTDTEQQKRRMCPDFRGCRADGVPDDCEWCADDPNVTDTEQQRENEAATAEREAVCRWLEAHAEWHRGRAEQKRRDGHTYAANLDAHDAGVLAHHAEVLRLRLHHDSDGPERGDR